MFAKMAESSGKVVGYKVIGVIKAEDFEKLAPEVESLIKEEGAIRILFDMSAYESEEAKAWLKDLKFGQKFHRQIEKMAIVGDKAWEKLIAYLAKPFYARDSKYFHTGEAEKAWAWLREWLCRLE